MAQCAKCGHKKLTEHPCPHCGSKQNAPLLTFLLEEVVWGVLRSSSEPC
jgi:uncharacterized OB-fold protein